MQLEENKIDQLLGIINMYPAIRVMHFSDGSHLLTKKIHELCKKHEYEYQLNCTNEIYFQKATTKYKDSKIIHIKRINLAQPRYNIQAKAYDYLFVTSDISQEERESFLKKSYSVIKNAGLILIFIPKGDLEQNYIWSELLSKNNFVATNTLDIFEQYDLIISKKMHGWGG